MDEQYYIKQLNGLILILDDADDKDIMIAREYMKEKLNMVLSGRGIGFHKAIKDTLATVLDDTKLAKGWEKRYREGFAGMYEIGKIAGEIEALQKQCDKLLKACKDGQKVRETKR